MDDAVTMVRAAFKAKVRRADREAWNPEELDVGGRYRQRSQRLFELEWKALGHGGQP